VGKQIERERRGCTLVMAGGSVVYDMVSGDVEDACPLQMTSMAIPLPLAPEGLAVGIGRKD